MDEQIAASLKGETTEVEEIRLREWRRASLANEKRYRELARLWADAEVAGTPVSTLGPPSAAQLLARLERPRGAPRPIAAWTRRALALAAVLVLGVGLGRFLLVGSPSSSFGAAELSTGPSESVTVRLDDGSTLQLGPESRLRLGRASRRREVWLDGRAYFAVAKQNRRPFQVHTASGDALVLGTRFEVRTGQRDFRLVVVEGRVAVAAGGERVEVAAGEMSQVLDGARPVVVKVADPFATIGWTEGVLMFQATPLHQVAAEVSRRYRVHVRIADSSLTTRTVSGTFVNRTFPQVMTVVCGVVEARCSLSDTEAVIRP